MERLRRRRDVSDAATFLLCAPDCCFWRERDSEKSSQGVRCPACCTYGTLLAAVVFFFVFVGIGGRGRGWGCVKA